MKYKNRRKKLFIILSFLSILVWIFDSLADYLFFYNASFMDLLILDVPFHQIYTRIFVICIFILFAFILTYRIRKEQEKYITLAENIQDMVLSYKLDGEITFANKKALEFFDMNKEELIGKNVNDLVNLRDMGKFKRRKKMREKGFDGKIQDIIVTQKNGKLHYYDFISSPLETENNQIKEILLRARDITDYHRTYKKMEKSERHIKTILNSIKDGVIATNKKGEITRINNKACSMIGLKRNEIVGNKAKEVLDLNILGDSNDINQQIEEVIKKGKIVSRDTSLILISKEGQKYHVEDNISPLKNGKGDITGAVMIFRDVTEKKELRYMQKILLTGIEQLQEKIIITNKNGIIEYVNKAFVEETGYSKREIIGEKIDIIKSDVHSHEFYKEMWKTILNGNVWEGEIINKRKDGELYNDYIFISPIYAKEESDHITNFICIQKNITKEKELKKRMRQSQKLESLGTLAGGIAHDFNNILLAIKSNIQMMKEIERGSKNSDKYLKNMLSAISRAEDLINQILTFTQESKKEDQNLDIKEIINDIVELFQSVFPSNIKIQTNIQKINNLYADPAQIYQIFMNLCTNAYHAMEENGGKLTIGINQLEVESADEYENLSEGDYIHITISDTGKGIPEKYVDKIFEPYFTTKTEDKGSGLGLSVVYGIVEEYNGIIELASEVKKGTRFDIYLPLNKKAQKKYKKKIKKEKSSFKYKKSYFKKTGSILYIDDEEALLDLVKERLEMEGYRVVTFNDPVKGLKHFKDDHEKYNLVLLDYAMPQRDGLKLASEMKDIDPGVNILILTGYIDELNEEQIKEYGAEKLLHKPVDFKDLIEVIEKYKI